MQDFLRRNFWVVHLAFLGAGSYLLAGVSTEVVATALLKNPAPAGAIQAAPVQPSAPRPVKPDSKVSLIATLQDHNPFDAEPKVVEEPSEDGDAKQPDLQLADLGVDLMGTLVSPNPEWSLAIIKYQNSSKLVRVGLVIGEVAEVAEISSRYIVLQVGEQRKSVRLWAEKGTGQRPGMGGPMPRAAIPVGPEPVAAVGSEFSKGVKKVGAYEYQIDRGMLEENLADLTKLGMQARVVPNYVDGKYQGFRLVGVRPDSLFRAIGLESGDLIRRINGKDIDTPNKAIELFDQLKSSPSITLDVERRGQKVQMGYTVK